MYKKSIIPVLFILILSFKVNSQEKAELTVPNPYLEESVFLADGKIKSFLLEGFIFNEDSIKVFINTELQEKSKYIFNRQSSEIEFKTVLNPGDSVRIIFLRYPFSLKKKYFNYIPENIPVISDSAAKDFVTDIIKPTEKVPDKTSKIIQTGSLIRGFTLGTNRDLNIESGLRMQLDGKIAEGVQITGALTDQTTPLQPEGNTQTLREIDKVFINLRSEKFSATFGDFELHHQGGELTDIFRKLKGFTGRYNTGSSDFSFSAAVSEGTFFTNKFTGTEGNQGPYQLKGKNGEINLIVLAGTEKVWINGERMQRGEDNDYIIDYSTGQVTFTRFRPVMQESRIEIDFEYSIQDFTRNILGIEGQTKLSENTLLYVSLFSESDKKDNPINYVYQEEDYNTLQTAGDSVYRAFRNGIFYKGEGEGNYVKIDSESVSFFVYTGENKGDYDIKFSYIGDGKGDYIFESFGVYRYVGDGNGDYSPSIKIPVPSGKKYGSFKLDYNKQNFFKFSSELGLSKYDINTYSSLNDNDDNGNAFLLNFSTDFLRKEFSVFKNFQFNIGSKIRHKNTQFNPIGRTDVIEFNRKWDLNENIEGNEDIFEVFSTISPFETTVLNFTAGGMDRGDSFVSNRKSMTLNSNSGYIENLFLKIEDISSKNNLISSDNDWLRKKGNINLKFKWLEPQITYEGEQKDERISGNDSYSFNYNDWMGKLNFFSGKNLKFYGNAGLRKDKKIRENTDEEDSQLISRGIGVEFNNGKNIFYSMMLQKREREYKIRDEKILNNLTDFKMRYTPMKKGVDVKINYKTSNNRTPLKERIYLKVEQGKGEYVYDEERGGYVPDKRGDLILRTITTEKFRDIFQKSLSIFTEIKPEKFSDNKIFKNIEARTFFRAENKLKFSSLNPLKISGFDDPVTSLISLTQHLTYNRIDNGFKFSLRINGTRNINNEYLDRNEKRTLNEYSLTLENYLKRTIRNRFDFSLKNEKREVLPFTQFDIDYSGLKITDELFYRWKNNVEFHIRNQFGKENDSGESLKINYLTVSPGVSFYFLEKGRANIDFEYYRVNTRPHREYIPFQMAEGRFPGDNYQLTGKVEYRVSTNISVNLYYNGEIRGGETKPYHIARGEIRAFF